MQTRTLLALMVGLMIGGLVVGEQAERGKLPARPRKQEEKAGLPPLPPAFFTREPPFWEGWATLAWDALEDYCPEWRGHARPLTPALLVMLRQGTAAEARQFAARALGEIGPPGVGLADEKEPLVAGLLRAVEKDEDGVVRRESLRALIRTARPSRRVLRVVGRATHDSIDTVALLAAECLIGRKVDVMPALREAFSGPKPSDILGLIVQARALGPKARPLVPALLVHLKSRDRYICGEAASALLAIDRRSFGKVVDAHFVRAARAAGTEPPECSPREPFAAHGALPRTVALAGEMLKSGTAGQKLWALRVAQIVGPDALPIQAAVEKMLENDEWWYEAAQALAAMGRPQKAVGRLVRQLKPEDRGFRYVRAFLATLRPVPQPVAEAVLDRFRRANGLCRLRAAAWVWALDYSVVGRERSLSTREEALSAMIEALKDPDWTVRRQAVNEISKIGPAAARAVPALVRWARQEGKAGQARSVLESGAFGELTRAIVKIGPGARDAVPLLREGLKVAERQSAVRCSGSHLWITWALLRAQPNDPRLLPEIQRLAREWPGAALHFLGEMGPRARLSAPWVVKMLRSSRHGEEASAGLWKIDPALARKVGAW
jgi:HEAT repeat protein